ncbi:hypothetical protein K8P63_19020 [Sphingomonas nostoxanthinifaciens]|nr:hypothetical protein K8P63_19020 [Sphingomonas nostoxanthinifaciens]
MFCSDAHQKAWKARTRRRGYQLYPFAIVARATREGTRGDRSTGSRASKDADQLRERWKDEDATKKRMTPAAYLALRYRLGFDRP